MGQQEFSPEKIDLKIAQLQLLRSTLKAEFVGIDTVIDGVVDSLSNWFLFPFLQERPVIVNLWGMTGVGKTALILRVAELLDYERKLFRYDMGNNSNRNSSLKEILRDVFLDQNGLPAMIMLDEFQHAKTKNENNLEIENEFSRVIWDLLDSGKFQSFEHPVNLQELIKSRELLNEALENGVTVKKGIVTNKEDFFLEMISEVSDEYQYGIKNSFHIRKGDNKTVFPFIPYNLIKPLYQCFPKKPLLLLFKKMLLKLDGPETIQLIDRAIESLRSNKWVDSSRCIIFILGNLDEAYTMSSSYNPDISANEFHESSRQININHIKFALRSRFRNEQISRLGNNHIIYPAFNEDSFYKLISLELKRITDKYLQKFHLELGFDDSFIQLLYAEGVYPSQGVRPLFSTIYRMVEAKFPMLFSKNLLKKLNAGRIIFKSTNEKVTFEYYKNGICVYQFDDNADLHLSKLRKPSKDDMQALVAVHEAGHAIISTAVLKVIPEYVCSNSSDVFSGGITVVKKKWKYLTREEVVYRIAENLGGLIAEKIIFGIDKTTRGAGQDIDEATRVAALAIKEYGMGSEIASINIADVHSKFDLHDTHGAYNKEVQTLLKKGAALAEKILLQEKKLLIQLSNYLSDERIIMKNMIEEMVRKYGSEEIRNEEFIKNGDHLFYRKKLKSLVVPEIERQPESLLDINLTSISLNKNQ